MEICCNNCWSPIEEKAFKTPCLHVYCVTCASDLFSRSKYTSCLVCSTNINCSEDLVEFQIVGGPIPDTQLNELQSMLLAVTAANGINWMSRQLELLTKFETTQYKGSLS